MIGKAFLIFYSLYSLVMQMSCSNSPADKQASQYVHENTAPSTSSIQTGADQLSTYLPLLQGKKVGLMGNQTSIVGQNQEHLVDVLLKHQVHLNFSFAPEHGFRGQVERGEKVSNEVDEKTGLPLYSLYGKNKLADSLVRSVDVMIFDLQDVGARFYTYITSLHELMQLCSRHNTQLIVLDRPNPNGDQVDGPVRQDDRFKSTVSFHKIAMIHGLTIGELARMINGEGWLDQRKKCDLTVIPLKNWDHKTPYSLPVVPSPSLPNDLAIRLYPSLCLFEATDISVGRGTDWPFQVLGYPHRDFGEFSFIPGTKAGMSAHVEQQNKTCYGIDLRKLNPAQVHFTLRYLLDFYRKAKAAGLADHFFSRPDFFNQLAGTDQLLKQIKAGFSEEEIRKSWQNELKAYKQMRRKYLLYPDFE